MENRNMGKFIGGIVMTIVGSTLIGRGLNTVLDVITSKSISVESKEEF